MTNKIMACVLIVVFAYAQQLFAGFDPQKPENAAELQKSSEFFDQYILLMHTKNDSTKLQKQTEWDNKYKGKTLLFKATMKSAKNKKGVATVDCKVNGKGVIVYLKQEEIAKAAKIQKGEVFYVRGKIAEKRWGIFHVLGLSDGEIVE